MNAISGLAARRLKREPVSRILGRKEFWSLALAVTPDVLVPRPETETVVEGALDFVVRNGLRMEKLRILDIGTGSGALLVALLSELPNAIGHRHRYQPRGIRDGADQRRAIRLRDPMHAGCLRHGCGRAGPVRSGGFEPSVYRPWRNCLSRAGGAGLRPNRWRSTAVMTG